MKVDVNIDNIGGRYQAQVSTLGFTALEEEKLGDFGEPLIDIGGAFSGTISRPGQTDTTVTLSGGNGTGAQASAILDEFGGIVGYTIVNGGINYTSPPAVLISGDGSGAVATAILSAGAVVSIAVGSPGSGYHKTPVIVSMTFPSQQLRMRSDFPVKKVFDLQDSQDADAQAKCWADTLVSRLATAKNALLTRSSPFEGETLTTV